MNRKILLTDLSDDSVRLDYDPDRDQDIMAIALPWPDLTSGRRYFPVDDHKIIGHTSSSETNELILVIREPDAHQRTLLTLAHETVDMATLAGPDPGWPSSLPWQHNPDLPPRLNGLLAKIQIVDK